MSQVLQDEPRGEQHRAQGAHTRSQAGPLPLVLLRPVHQHVAFVCMGGLTRSYFSPFFHARWLPGSMPADPPNQGVVPSKRANRNLFNMPTYCFLRFRSFSPSFSPHVKASAVLFWPAFSTTGHLHKCWLHCRTSKALMALGSLGTQSRERTCGRMELYIDQYSLYNIYTDNILPDG